MKTPAQWLAQIKQASDTEVRHGSSVILLESDIREILYDGYKQGMIAGIDFCINKLREEDKP